MDRDHTVVAPLATTMAIDRLDPATGGHTPPLPSVRTRPTTGLLAQYLKESPECNEIFLLWGNLAVVRREADRLAHVWPSCAADRVRVPRAPPGPRRGVWLHRRRSKP